MPENLVAFPKKNKKEEPEGFGKFNVDWDKIQARDDAENARQRDNQRLYESEHPLALGKNDLWIEGKKFPGVTKEERGGSQNNKELPTERAA